MTPTSLPKPLRELLLAAEALAPHIEQTMQANPGQTHLPGWAEADRLLQATRVVQEWAKPTWDQQGFAEKFQTAHFNHEMGWFTPMGKIDSEVMHRALTMLPIPFHQAQTLFEGYLVQPEVAKS